MQQHPNNIIEIASYFNTMVDLVLQPVRLAGG
jgi:hypothetical protein